MTSPCRGLSTQFVMSGTAYRYVPIAQHAATSPSKRRTTCYRWLPRHVFVSVPAPFLHPGISSGPSAVRFAPDSRAGSDTKMPGHAAAGQETGSAPHSHAPQIPDLRGHGTGPAPPAASSKAASSCPATTVIRPAAPARQILQSFAARMVCSAPLCPGWGETAAEP